MQNTKQLTEIAKLVRYYILKSTTAAGSGHPSSSLSATDLMTTLMFGGFFRADLEHPEYHNNDRLIFSKGHAAPLFYSLYAAAGAVSEEEMMTLRKFDSPLEGHPTLRFPYTEVPTGSLGQGLSVGVGMALNAQMDKLSYKTFVLLGDSEMAEGSNWEAMQLAAHYKLNNLIAVLDVNRLGQRGETMYGHNVKSYAEKFKAFGWNAIVVDGHKIDQIAKAYKTATTPRPSLVRRGGGRPTVIIAKTIKGKGVKFIENKEGWHGKVLNAEECEKAVMGLGKVNKELRGKVAKPGKIANRKSQIVNRNAGYQLPATSYKLGDMVATRKAYGNALARLYPAYPDMVVLDAETSNSTGTETFKKAFPKRFFEMFIAEQNMVGTAMGLSRRGKIPFISTFTAFFTRAFDQIRMSQYAEFHPATGGAGIKFVGSHGGVSIGEDGSSQMGLEEIGMFRSLLNSVVLYPSDAVATEKLVEAAVEHKGNVYIQTTRMDTLVLYRPDEKFPIGGSKTLYQSKDDVVTVVGAGVTLYEALKAYSELKRENIFIRVIDLYSIKPLDTATLEKAARETGNIIVVEDQYVAGGIGEAVRTEIGNLKLEIGEPMVVSLAVRKMPRSGKPEELLVYEEIDAKAIVKTVKELMG